MTYQRKEVIGDCELYLGDCLDVLPTLNKVDAVITDWAEAVRLRALAPKRSTDDLAQYTGTTGRQFRRLRGRGLDWLCLWVGVAGLLHSRQKARKK